MSSTQHASYVPLSPVLIAGMVARPLPVHFLQPVLQRAMTKISTHHPDLFERLTSVGSPRFLILPSDLPFGFLMDTDANHPKLDVYKKDDPHMDSPVDATIQGPLEQLLQLLEGRIDGDALFFSRSLIIQGDTEAVVALRNAIDSADIQIEHELTSLFGPLSRPAKQVMGLAGRLFNRARRDLATLNQAALAPLQRKCDAQAATIENLEETVIGLKKQLRRKNTRSS